MNFPEKLNKKLQQRIDSCALRNLSTQNDLVDFSSNDYLGFSQSDELFKETHQLIEQYRFKNGSTGSRLLSGNHQLHEEVEQQLAGFFNAESALLFNSGYDANIGLFSSVPQRGDIILYDEFIHASIRDGIQMSNANSFKFAHNNLDDLEHKMARHAELLAHTTVEVSASQQHIYIATESVFSMDGDSPDLIALVALCKKHNAHLIVDEAHATGVLGNNGEGLVTQLHLEKDVFARVHTFGKAMGCHGAVILGSEQLQSYLINFARSFIYTTAMPLHNVATIKAAFEQLTTSNEMKKLQNNINYFNQQLSTNNNQLKFVKSNSAIHSCIISGNDSVKHSSKQLAAKGFDVKAILSPTVPKGQERLRICLHSFNTFKEISTILQLLPTIK